MREEWKRIDGLDCFPEIDIYRKWKCYLKSGLVSRDIGLFDKIGFSDVPDVRVEPGHIRLVPTNIDTEYRISEYDMRYLNIRRKG